MKKLITLLASIALLFSCSSLRLEKKLPKDIRTWYDAHSIWMETKVPTWIYDGNKSEKWCFLRLPEQLQRFYIAVFWEIRKEGLAEEFYGNVHLANIIYSTEGKPGWKTDRGNILIRCGIPHFRQVITVNELAFRWTSNPMNRGIPFRAPQYDTDGTVYVIWEYYRQREGARFVFRWAGNRFKLCYNSLAGVTYQTEFMRKRKELYAPTLDGWDLIGGWVYELTKGKEK